jgi:hypothetical protein
MAMKTILMALGGASLLALAAPAWADSDLLVHCEVPPGTATKECPVNLTQGRDYLLRKRGDWGEGCIEMVNPQRNAFVPICGYSEGSQRKEFRAGQTGTFWVRIRDGATFGEAGDLFTDCKDANTTRCRLPLTGTHKGGSNAPSDFDRWKTVSLRKGRTYRLTFTTDRYTEVEVRKADGTRIVGGNTSSSKTISFRAPADGPVYVRARLANYTLALR